ncbi:MAG: hypothetical protein SFU99_19985 [Saprospiraceae bacterium]|nr:hypothetical protein [Saprospiraceae bacterium]
MLKTKIKAGPITNLTDARYFAAREVEWLSFDFDEASETYLSPAQMSAIREWVDGVQFIGEFGIASAADIRQQTQALKLDAIQVNMLTNIETLIDLQLPVPIFKEMVIEQEITPEALNAQLELFQPWVQVFILNFEKNNMDWQDLLAGKPFSITELQDWCKRFSIVLSIDFQKEMLNNFLNVLPFYGLCVKGGTEEKIGYKSFEELDEIFDYLEEVEQY